MCKEKSKLETMREGIVDLAKEASKDWNEIFDEPMDGDEAEELAEYFELWLNYYQGNTSEKELLEKIRKI